MEGSRATTAPGGEVDVSWELEMRLGISLYGAKVADWAAVYSTSQMALWRAILSPLPHTEPTWWSPWGSAVLWHSGQT